ncbi:hypothetical protein OHB41_51625 [Streptomyces sp. NBC_01571]|nr:hypothetical protein [Streptomyces sp. NBC_01571]MCX4581411.1 hypothetical protein [Streptomyces sp. NBC_01571]
MSVHVMIKAADLAPAATPVTPLTSRDEHRQSCLQLPCMNHLN